MTRSRDEFVLELRAENIGASVHYAPLHAMPLYARGEPAFLPHTERLAERIVTLPISASMSLEDADEVAERVCELLGRSLKKIAENEVAA